MATEYKLSYTASEINEKLANVDVLESRIETLEENGKNIKSPGVVRKLRRVIRNMEQNL